MESEGSLPCLPLAPILSQMNPVHSFPSSSSKIHSNIILAPTLRSSDLYLPFWLSNQNFVRIFHAFYMPLPSRPSRYDHPK